MEKTIHVVDEYGNSYQPTYPKRARGLVRNGRARYVAEDTICLTVSMAELLDDPADELEEAEYQQEAEEASMAPLQEQPMFQEPMFQEQAFPQEQAPQAQFQQAEPLPAMARMDLSCVREYLDRLERLCTDTGYLSQAFATLEKIPNDAPEEVARLKVDAVREIVAERERTLQNLMDHYMAVLNES